MMPSQPVIMDGAQSGSGCKLMSCAQSARTGRRRMQSLIGSLQSCAQHTCSTRKPDRPQNAGGVVGEAIIRLVYCAQFSALAVLPCPHVVVQNPGEGVKNEGIHRKIAQPRILSARLTPQGRAQLLAGCLQVACRVMSAAACVTLLLR